LFLAFPGAWAQASGVESLFFSSGKQFSRALSISSQSPRRPAEGAPVRAVGFEEGSFRGAGGKEIHYLYRGGKGPAILLIHGTILAAEAQKQGAQEFFPGRPVMAIYRRGYAPSQVENSGPEALGFENAEDISKAIAIARDLGEGGKVCLLAFSLGAMMLPAVDAQSVLWAALVNPGAAGMLGHLPAEQQMLSWALKNSYEASRYWHPEARKAWIRSASQALADDLIDLIRTQQPQGAEEFSDFLIERIRTRMQRRSWQELIIKERLWALFYSREVNLPKNVPVFMAASRSDGMIPPEVYEELLARLKASASWVREVRWAGGHLSPVFAPDILIRELSSFDRAVASGARR
jgi:pimeloyl-ACP methyl ester carboxylesterase